MTAVENKEEISDSDSGIILHCGPDSPTSPAKEPSTHTRALKLKHQSLEERLELCLLELRKLCIREAELTGKLPCDYPMLPDEKPPRVRRRIGASFKLDEGLIHLDQEDAELKSLETDLALQRQIYEAARKLSLEDHLSKPQKKSRLQQCKREEKKVKELQEAVLKHRVKSECSSPCLAVTSGRGHDLSMSDDSSLSDVVALDDDVDPASPLPPPPLDSSPSDPLKISAPLQSPHYERSPIQNSPWKESSLDQPYQKALKPESACSSRSSSPAGPPVTADSGRIPVSHFIKNSALRHTHTASAPSTPELHIRRQFTQSFRLPKSKPLVGKDCFGSENSRGWGRLPQRRCAADFTVRSPEFSPLRPYQSSSEDSSSELSSSASSSSSSSASSHTSSPGRDGPTEIPKLCPPPYGFHFGAERKGQCGPVSPVRTAGRPPLSPQNQNTEKGLLLHSPSKAGSPKWPEAALSPPKRVSKQLPPPPYSRLARTPSLKDYPNHTIRLMPREVVSEELKSWHQRNQLQKSRPDQLGVTSPTSPHLPSFQQGSGNVVLQRAADGTPLQWFVAQDSEIISQV